MSSDLLADRAPHPEAPGPPRGRGGVVIPALLAPAALAAFALVMSVVTGPGTSAEIHHHVEHGGPVAADYVAIAAAPALLRASRAAPAASTGSFAAHCGRNADGHRNSDNFITAAGRSNGAHHVHDYVGNTSTDGDSSRRGRRTPSTASPTSYASRSPTTSTSRT